MACISDAGEALRLRSWNICHMYHVAKKCEDTFNDQHLIRQYIQWKQTLGFELELIGL